MQKQVWRRGDLVARGNEPGFVSTDMSDRDEYLVVRWKSGLEKIHHSKLSEIRRFTETEESSIVRDNDRSAIDDLEALESLDRIHAAVVERSRTIKSPREQRMVDNLIRRGYAKDYECEWDRKNADLLRLLALKPNLVGWRFKLLERLHRPVHALFHRH